MRLGKLKVTFRTLKYKNYRYYFFGQIVSNIGTWIQVIALSWLIYKMTNSALLLGISGFLSRIPTLVISPFAGVVVDKFNKYKLLMVTQIMAMVQAILLAILVFTNFTNIWWIIALGFIGGIISSFDVPTRQAFIIELVEDKNDLSNAIVLNSMIINISRLIGPTIAGLLVAIVGEGWCFSINAISFIAIIGSLIALDKNLLHIVSKDSKTSIKISEGFIYAWRSLPIRSVLLLLALVSLMGMPYQVLMPIFAKDILHGGSNTMGFLMAGISIGAIVGAMFLGSRTSLKGTTRNIALAAFIFGVGLCAFAYSKVFLLSFLNLVIVGLGMMAQITSSNTILQSIVDDDKRGRVMSFYTMAFMGMVPLGNLLAGTLADKFGAPSTVAIGGVASMVGASLFWLKYHDIRDEVKTIIRTKNAVL